MPVDFTVVGNPQSLEVIDFGLKAGSAARAEHLAAEELAATLRHLRQKQPLAISVGQGPLRIQFEGKEPVAVVLPGSPADELSTMFGINALPFRPRLVPAVGTQILPAFMDLLVPANED